MVAGAACHAGVLGTSLLASGDQPLRLTPIQRRLLAALVLRRFDGAGVDQLVSDLWGTDPPTTARPSLHNHLARLRLLLPDATLAWNGTRYRLDSEHLSLDLDVFSAAVAVATGAASANDPTTALQAADAALGCWRGPPYADLPVEHGLAAAERVHLAEQHDVVEEIRARALVDHGRFDAAVSCLRRLVADRPDREVRWELLLLALARAGRRSDALAVYLDARQYFVTELGLEPPARLQRAQRRILMDGPQEWRDSQPATAPVGLEALVADLDADLERHGAVLLTGEAGIGKSTVARAVATRRRSAGKLVVEVTCLTNPWSALQPVIDLLQQLRPILGALEPPPGPTVQHLLRRSGASTLVTQGGDADLLLLEFARTLTRIAEANDGLTIVLDDAHRGGPTSHRAFLAALDASTAIRLLVATREEGALPQPLRDRLTRHQLAPLVADAVRALVDREVADDADAAPLVGWLLELTGGNPLFVLAVLGDLRRRGQLVPDTSGQLVPPAAVTVPAQLRETIEASVASLSLAARQALDVVAVFGDPTADSLLAQLVDPAPLDAAIDAGILELTDDRVLTFHHEMLRLVTYELIPRGRRLELHHAIAAIHRQLGGSASQVATHAIEAREIDPVGAAAAAEAAGDEATATMAYHEAFTWYGAAAAAVSSIEGSDETERLRLRVEAADAQRLAGIPGHAELLLDVAEAAAASPDHQLRRRAVLAALRLGESAEAGPHQHRAARLAVTALDRETDPAARAMIAAAASLVHSMSGEPERCRSLLLDALAYLADDDEATAVQVLPYAYMGLSHVDDWDHRAEVAARLRHDAAIVDDPVGAFEAHHLTFSVALQRADGDLARASHASMRTLLSRVGDAGRRWQFAYQQAALAHLDGRLADAEAAADEALRIGSGVAASRALGAYAGQVLELRRADGRLSELAPLMTQLIDQQTVLPAWKAAASYVLATSDPQRSAALFDDLATDGFVGLPRDFAWLASLQLLTRGAVVRGDVLRAAAAARVLSPYADRVVWQSTCCYGPLATVLAEVARLEGDDGRARSLAELAVDRATTLRAPFYAAEARALLTD